MSARAVTLWFIDTDTPVDVLRSGVTNDVDAAKKLASAIYGDSVLVPSVDTNLAAAMDSDDSQVYAGFYGPLTVVSCSLFATSKPSTLTRTVETIRTAASIPESAAAVLLYTEPESATGVFARWEGGTLRRSFAADPVSIIEDDGLPYPFEKPFWGGEHPLRYAPGVAPDPLALPFHPQQLAEQGNREWLGFRFTRPLAPSDLEPLTIPVTGFAIRPADYEPTEADDERYREASTTAAAATAAATAAAASAREQALQAEPAPEPRPVVDSPPEAPAPVPGDTPAVGIPIAEPIASAPVEGAGAVGTGAEGQDEPVVEAEVVDAEVVEPGVVEPGASRPGALEFGPRDAPGTAAVEDAVTAPVPSVSSNGVGGAGNVEAANVDQAGLPAEGEYVDESAGWTRRVARYFGFGADK
ncbi:MULTISPECIES: DUF6928 family protein [Gordonia]|uniref:DUF6928 family protein n=1 Tax=Gordonia sp. 852002-10350_SCH5691597 TaxID=1834085 RepID=UPI0007EAF42A|nr:hypothetical protein A5777_22000 [Gordonia sp. 852002-10350_SCH5691597]